jgi:squalene-associated FAD-dependent desaturase
MPGEHAVAVVGGGWAGLSAALELACRGQPVTLLESAATLGGRARDVATPLGTLDTGQHLTIGAYHAMLGLLERLGVPEETVLRRRTLLLRMSDLAGGAEVRLQVPALPAPLHLAKALTTARGLGLFDRLAAVRFVDWLRKRRFEIEDAPLGTLLAERGQTAHLVRALWEPLCLATLNTPLADASARIYAHVLGLTFTGNAHNCDLLLPRETLGTLIPARVAHALAERGARVLCGARVVALEHAAGAVRGVRLADGTRLPAAHVVLAVPPAAAARLVGDLPRLAPLAAQLAQFTHQPIATVYLRYPETVRIEGALRGVLGGLTQWLFDRRDTGQPGLVAAVISAAGPHEALDRDTLSARVVAEAARIFPAWPAPLATLAIREKRATFASRAGIEALRPGCATALPGLWLAGDWTATGLPATLEGAVQSGLESARAVAEQLAAHPAPPPETRA